MDPRHALAIILPTRNEVGSIGGVLRDIAAHNDLTTTQVIIVDDASTDGTTDVARTVAKGLDIELHVIVRTGERGLATAVLAGMSAADAEHIVVMDADGQHPASAVKEMHTRALTHHEDVVIGSRDQPGGSRAGLNGIRRFISWLAASFAMLMLPTVRQLRVTDPLSGLFMVRSNLVQDKHLEPTGFKILLEVLVRAKPSRVGEVAYAFGDRLAGQSKLGMRSIVQYAIHVLRLATVEAENRMIALFLLVGASGILVNMGTFMLLWGVLGWVHTAAALVAIQTSILTNFLLNDSLTFRAHHHRRRFIERLARFESVSLAAMVANLVILETLVRGANVYPPVAELFAIVGATVFNYGFNRRWAYAASPRALRERGG